MKKQSFLALGAACLLGFATSAQAQPFGGPQGPGPGGMGGPGGGPDHEGPHAGIDHRGPGPERRPAPHGRLDHRMAGPGRNRDGGWHDNNPDMNRVWHQGERYDGPRNSRWIVNDWQGHRGLSAPPSGYQWMRYGNQYLLTAITTGVIAGVVSATLGGGMR
ncbi:RcnB family protein [Komagataeibacter sucrofermentans]|uniref:RcnB family protein n=1 Tax=Komagataeibacter sucrofermentans TaxID=1053551 RepID=A0A318QN40_9PROT|nr:RcnB family protein [Komagataeibacter sucrofermentans]PYD78771.1 hypothetical protein CFR77_09545 [Komagataeibacter sucrofermentans]